MVEAKKQPSPSRWWWFERLSAADGNQKRSPWLQITLAELDEKTRSMLKLIEEDADSFAQRAEMYYKKRPQLISLVEDFYRTHRSLAERYDLHRPDSGKPGLVTSPWESPSSVTKCSEKKFTNTNSLKKSYDSCSETYESPLSVAKCGKQEKEKPYDSCSETCESPLSVAKCGKQEKEKSYDSYSETCGLPLSVAKCGKLPEKERAYDSYSETYESEEESDVEDPEPEHEPEPKQQNDDVMMTLMQEEMERLEEENKAQKEEMIRKDEEKRDVIRQLSLAMDLLREENQELRKRVMVPKKQNHHRFAESNKMDAFWKKLFFNKSSA